MDRLTNQLASQIVDKYIDPVSSLGQIYWTHVRAVAALALHIAQTLDWPTAEQELVVAGSLVHDIGIVQVRDEQLGCTGTLPYICHGVAGAHILLAVQQPQWARIAERHTGVGITAAEIVQQHLPLPARDLVPETAAERLVAYADKFYSKNPARGLQPYSVLEIENHLQQFGKEKVIIFRKWQTEFGGIIAQ